MLWVCLVSSYCFFLGCIFCDVFQTGFIDEISFRETRKFEYLVLLRTIIEYVHLQRACIHALRRREITHDNSLTHTRIQARTHTTATLHDTPPDTFLTNIICL